MGLLDSISPAAGLQAGVGVIQAGIGIAQSINGNKRLNRLLQQREDYKSPDEVQQQYQLAQNEAQTGYGAATMSYFTNQTNSALTNSLNTASKLGADPNSISSIFSKNVDAIIKTSSDSEMTRMMKFDKLYASIAKVIEGKDAEFADRRAKQDDLAAAARDKVKAGNENFKSGINGVMGSVANNETSKLGGPLKSTPSTDPVMTRPSSAVSSATGPALGTTVTGAPLGGSIALPSMGATPDYGQLLNFYNTQFQRR